MSKRLDGKVAIITGAGSGIGRASALLFAAEGAKLVLGDKTDAVRDVAKAIVASGGQATAFQMDAGVEADVANLVAAAQTAYGRLDVAFANAGIAGGMASIFEATPELWTEVLRVNLIGPWLMPRYARSGRSACCRAARHALTARRMRMRLNSAAISRPTRCLCTLFESLAMVAT